MITGGYARLRKIRGSEWLREVTDGYESFREVTVMIGYTESFRWLRG